MAFFLGFPGKASAGSLTAAPAARGGKIRTFPPGLRPTHVRPVVLLPDSEPESYGIASVSEIIAELRAGRIVILVDEEDRENEGDLVMAAEFVTPEAINFMVTHGRGLVCLTLTEERCRQLDLPLMAARNGTRYGTNFTQSIEAAEGVETGISAADRARTIQVAVARDKPSDLVQPGHIFPVRAVPGGVLVRAGHTEAGCDLTAMAGLTPAAVICEILKPDGTMARLPDLVQFARQHQLKIGTIADLIQYRSEHESIVKRLGRRRMQTAWGGSTRWPTRTPPRARPTWPWCTARSTPTLKPWCACTSRPRCWTCWTPASARTAGACPTRWRRSPPRRPACWC